MVSQRNYERLTYNLPHALEYRNKSVKRSKCINTGKQLSIVLVNSKAKILRVLIILQLLLGPLLTANLGCPSPKLWEY